MGDGDHMHRIEHRHARMLRVAAIGALVAIGLGGCAAQIDRHGHQFTEAEIRQVQPGMSKDQVRTMLGTPDTTTAVGGEVMYYISSTKSTVSFLTPKEIDRKVLAVYFNPIGSVEKVANYGLKDGKVIDLITRETPSHAGERNFLNQLFRNLGTKQLYGD